MVGSWRRDDGEGGMGTWRRGGEERRDVGVGEVGWVCWSGEDSIGIFIRALVKRMEGNTIFL